MTRRVGMLAVVLPVLAVLLAGCTGSTLQRTQDPVVLTGANLPTLNGIAPNLLVAFRYTNNAWVQIPVQVDERANVSFGQIYQNQGGFTYTGTALVYTDPNTWTGPDPNANIDGDDEVVFMVRDAGGPAPAQAEPAGVVPDSGVQVRVTDPLSSGVEGFVYLFRQSGGLDPSAGANYVTYNFNLLSGNYKATYKLTDGPNPENTTVTSPNYSVHFGDRWLSDELKVTVGGSSGVDILDRRKALLQPGNCGRSENTFDDAEGAFITNKDGPVRAIRSYLGANSGPYTQRTHLFYEDREDVITDLRVHAGIPGVLDFFDYSPAASGMSYSNSLNPSGVTIDGNPDNVNLGLTSWERVAGSQAGLAIAHQLQTTLTLSRTQYYLDDSTPAVTQCTGDSFAYGQSGPYINQTLPSTDPSLGSTDTLKGTRTLYYEGPSLTSDQAATRYSQATNPMTTTVTSW